MPDASLIGRPLDEFPLPVDRSKVREFAKALFDEDPIYVDESAARDAGFGGIPAPLTFAAASMHFRDDLALFQEHLGLDLRRVLHGESTWEYLAPIEAGDELVAHRRIADIATRPGKRGGEMTLITFEIDFVNQHGDTVLRERDVVIQTGAAT
jgi:acyl dehydratase